MRGEGMERMAKLARNIEYYIGKADLNLRYDDDHIDLARFVLAVMPVVKAAETFKRCPSSANCGGLFDAIDAFTATEAEPGCGRSCP
jgi:hypothetical protein